MSKLKVFETELALRNLAKALPGHEEAINGTLDKVASLEARLKAAEDAADKHLHEDKRHQRALLAAEAELARLKAQEPVAYTDAEELETLNKGTFADMFTPCDQYKNDPQWIPLYAEPRQAVLDRKKLRDLVDVVWGDAAETPVYLSTEWADRLINQVFSCAAEPRPAVLPDKLLPYPSNDKEELAYARGYNQAIDDAKALGCQPQQEEDRSES